MRKSRPRKPPYVRQRIRGGLLTTDFRFYSECVGPLPHPWQPNWTYKNGVGLTGMVESMTDTVTPGYREIVARGGIVNTGASRVKISVSPYQQAGNTHQQAKGSYNGSTGFVAAKMTSYGDGMAWAFGPVMSSDHETNQSNYPLPTSLAALQNKAMIQALKSVQPNLSQSWVTLAERKKTMDMITDRVRKLADVVQATTHRDVQRLEFMFPGKRTKRYPKRVALWDANGNPMTGPKADRYRYGHLPTRPTPISKMDEASKLWLEFRYGWSPLVYDIVDSLKAMYADDLRKELIQRERFTSRGFSNFTGAVTSTASNAALDGTQSIRKDATHEVSCRAYILYRMSSPMGIARRLNDFGAFDVPRAIWELVPWSFVIDWFIPIGDFLAAHTPKVGVEILASGLETKWNIHVSRTVTSYVSSPATGDLSWTAPIVPVGSVDSGYQETWWRSPGALHPTFPPVEVNLNLKRLADAVALFKRVR